jgi:DNA-binding MarR family transcriptional regulator
MVYYLRGHMNKPFTQAQTTVGFRIMHTMRHIHECIDRTFVAENIPLVGDQVPLFMLSSQFEGSSIMDLAGIIKRDKAGIFRGLRTLEKHGFIRFQCDAHDRRKRLVYLTSLGNNLRERILKKMEEVDDLISQGITAKELELMYAVFDKISANCLKILGIDALGPYHHRGRIVKHLKKSYNDTVKRINDE